MSQDALSYKYGRSRTARDSTYKFLLAIGPVGGTHYLVRWLDDDGGGPRLKARQGEGRLST